MDNDNDDISDFSDKELYVLMDLDDPSDRVLEAKILQLIDKYEKINNKMGKKLLIFFEDVYERFFGDSDEIIEGFESTVPNVPESTPTDTLPPTTSTEVSQTKYAKGSLNPIKKETIQRTVSIDSQYRDRAVYPVSSAFTFNLSDSLVDVVSIKLNSVQIPYTWYTISNEFGSNLFFLKGSSPGIDQGNFDYRLSIIAGNYQAADFEKSINTSFSEDIFALNPDVNFGSTGVSYNSINSRLTTKIDIKNIYNETNYNLRFSNFPSYGIDASNVLSIPQLLGFKDTIYTPCTIFSSLFKVIPSDTYTITTKNNKITIYLYQSQLSLKRVTQFNSESILSTINITSTLLGEYTPIEILADFQNQIKLSPYLKTNKSSFELENISSVQARFKLNLVLNRKKVANEVNLKSVVYFEEDTSYLPIWTKTSIFRFTSSYNELNNILSEEPSVRTKYLIGSNVNITFTSNNEFYSNSSNNQKNYIPKSNFNSKQYLTAINNAFRKLAFDTNNKFNCSIDVSKSLLIPTISCNIDYSIPFLDESTSNSNFSLETSYSVLHTVCKFPQLIVKPITHSSFALQAGGYNAYSNDNRTNFFTIHSNGPRNSNVPLNIVTIQDNFYEYLETMFDAINASFLTSLLNNVDASQSKITFSIGIDGIVSCTLFLDIKAKLTSNDYNIFLNDIDNQNSWYNYLGFQDISNKLIQIPGSPIAEVKSLYSFYSNELILTSTNNSFTIDPVFDPNGGVYTPTNNYQITKILTLPLDISYTKEEIVDNINFILFNDALTIGSYVDTSQPNTIIRVNVNKIFTAQDYRIVFFDKSFTHCNYGLTSTIGNVKWDTTLGWILGYRNVQEYFLNSTLLSDNGISTYYSNFTDQAFKVTSDNIVSLTGDTSINVNLYNYVMIVLDDYCQNHLNDGLVTITKQDYDIPLPSYANRSTYKCDETTRKYSISNPERVEFNNLTAKQLYSANQILNTQTIKQSQNIYSPGPYVQDIFGIVPIKTSGLQPGQSFIEFGGTLQNQERSYFGPVNISKMSIQLLNDKGSVIDLNNANWYFSFLVEMLYNPDR